MSEQTTSIGGILFRRCPDGEYRAPGLRLHQRDGDHWILWSALGATFGSSAHLAVTKHRARLERSMKALGFR